MSRTEKTALRLVGQIYDAAEKPELWPIFLTEAADALRSNLATIVLHDLTSFDGTVALMNGASPEAQKAYETLWGVKNIYFLRGVGRLRPGTVVHGGMLCTDEEILRSDYYNEFLRPNDWFYAAGGPITTDCEVVSLFSIQRPRRKGQFEEWELELIRQLMPHLQRAVRMHHHLHTLQSSVQAVDSLAIGIIAVNASGKLLMANHSARKILQENDGLALTRNGIVVIGTPQARQFADLISAAATTGNGFGLNAGGALRVERPSGKRPYAVLVSPTHSAGLTCTSQRPTTIIFVSDPEQRPRPAAEVLRSLFALTAAESRVALLLGDGNSPGEIAEMLRVSSNTLKSHLSSIYAKTNTSRQAELVRLLMTLPTGPAA